MNKEYTNEQLDTINRIVHNLLWCSERCEELGQHKTADKLLDMAGTINEEEKEQVKAELLTFRSDEGDSTFLVTEYDSIEVKLGNYTDIEEMIGADNLLIVSVKEILRKKALQEVEQAELEATRDWDEATLTDLLKDL